MKKIKKILSLMLAVLISGFAPLVNGMYQESISDEERLILESKSHFVMIGFDDYKPEKFHCEESGFASDVEARRICADRFSYGLLGTFGQCWLTRRDVWRWYGVDKVVFKRCSDIPAGDHVYTYDDSCERFNVRITLNSRYVLVESPEIPRGAATLVLFDISKNVIKNLQQQARALGLEIEDCTDI